jgi:cytochrome b
MKKTLTILGFLAVFPAGVALSDDDCSVPMADWQPRDAVAGLAEENGCSNEVWLPRSRQPESLPTAADFPRVRGLQGRGSGGVPAGLGVRRQSLRPLREVPEGPGETLAYLGDMTRGRERRYLGHNPAGAAMIVALPVTLSGTPFTGWLIEDEARLAMLPSIPAHVAPAWADDDGDGDEREYGERGEVEGPLKEVHETLANLMLLLAAVHVGVVLASFRHQENLARAMVTGDKRGPGPGDVAGPHPYPRPTVPSARPGLASRAGPFSVRSRSLPDGKLKRESGTRQEALRSDLHIAHSRRQGDPTMKKTLTLLVASTALTAAIGVPAWSAMQAPADGVPRPVAALFDDVSQAMPLVLASDDDDDEEDRWRDGSRRGDDDEDDGDDDDGDDDDDDDCDDDEDDDDCRGGARNPAPAGTVAPPQNGLFGNGAPPKVQVN